MPFPSIDRVPDLQAYFDEYYFGKYMVWNFSEQTYDTNPFGEQVIDCINVGYPCAGIEQILVT